MKKTKEPITPKTPFKYRKHSDTIVASIITTIQILMLTICTIFAYITVDNRTTATGGGGVTPNNPTFISNGNHAHALTITDGKLYSWGYNNLGQLGDGTTTNRLSPVRIGTASNWVVVSAGARSSLAVNYKGEIFTWGSNGADGRLGLGDTIPRASPTKVPSLTLAGYDVAQPSDGAEYIISDLSATNIIKGGAYTFTITTTNGHTMPMVRFTSPNGKLSYTSIDMNTLTVTITNITGNINSSDFTISVSKTL